MVRKDGYFSITDACIKHCRANFLIVRPKKNSFRFSLRTGEVMGGAEGHGGRLLHQQCFCQCLGQDCGVWSMGKQRERSLRCAVSADRAVVLWEESGR